MTVGLFAAVERGDVGAVDDGDVFGVKMPRRRGAGRGVVFAVAGWWSGWLGGHSAVTSVMAVRAAVSSTMGLLSANAAVRAWMARLLTARG